MLRNMVSNPIGTWVYCDTPSRLTTPPSRTTPNAVASDCSVPTHSTDGVGAVTPGQRADLLDAFVAALGDDVGGAELPTKIGAVTMAAHQDDLLGAQSFGGQHRAESDCAVADDDYRMTGLHPRGFHAVVTGAKHVRQRQQ